ncbi:MAG: hypothetical protein CMH83_18800 [Nocardioides sp.]|nr:hypothetical protein [Nocardioides sp.]
MTTIEVPVSEPAHIRPPEGSPDEADALATTLYAAAGRYEEVAEASTQLQDLHDAWWGSGYVAYRSAAHRAGGEHDRLATTMTRVARTITAFADTLRDLRDDSDDLVGRKLRLDRDRDDLLADVRAASAADVTDAEVGRLQLRAAYLAQGYRLLVLDHDDLQRRVRANEDLLRQAFAAADTLGESLSDGGGLAPLAVGAMSRPGAPGTGAGPSALRSWWEGLTDAEREAVVAAYPRLVGGSDGLPASARDDANRVLLDDDLATLGSKDPDDLTPQERRILSNARRTQEALDTVDDYVDPLTGERPGGVLHLYDPGAYDGDGRVALGIGDLDTADDLAVMVPGVTTTTDDLPDSAQDAVNVYESARSQGDGSSVGVMFWLGYDAPDELYDPATLTEDRAETGGGQLADYLDGLRASRSDDPHLTAIGHSYGSTTLSHALDDHDPDVDDAVLVGSPGAGEGNDRASDLGLPEGHVYVGRNSRDPIALLGDEGWVGLEEWSGVVPQLTGNSAGLGTDPSSDDFGATRFEAESADRSWHLDPDEHSRYYDPDSESLYNIGRVVDGRGADVNEAPHSYDPWWGAPQDPEWGREPAPVGEPGRSSTGPSGS